MILLRQCIRAGLKGRESRGNIRWGGSIECLSTREAKDVSAVASLLEGVSHEGTERWMYIGR